MGWGSGQMEEGCGCTLQVSGPWAVPEQIDQDWSPEGSTVLTSVGSRPQAASGPQALLGKQQQQQ